jgi:hypothetical protein
MYRILEYPIKKAQPIRKIAEILGFVCTNDKVFDDDTSGLHRYPRKSEVYVEFFYAFFLV